MAVYRGEFNVGEFNVGHPDFSNDSQAKNSEATTPVDATAPKIEYTPEDDKVIDDFLRQNGKWYEVSRRGSHSSSCLQLVHPGIL